MKALRLTLWITLLAWGAAQGGTITATSNSGFSVRDSGGNLISGGAIRVGFLDLSDAGDFVVENATDIQLIEALWTPLAEGTTDGGSVMQSGNSGQTLIVNDQFGLGDFFGQITNATSFSQGTKLFLWVFNHPTPSEATEWAIVSSSSSSWTMPGTLGATTLSTGSIDQIHRGLLTGSELKLESKDSPTGFDAWAVSHFDSSQLSSTEASEDADPDGDDWTNLMEYVFDTDPLQASSANTSLGHVQIPNGEVALIFQPAPGRDDVEISAFTSIDLLVWSPAIANETALGVFQVPLPSGGRGFARIELTRIP